MGKKRGLTDSAAAGTNSESILHISAPKKLHAPYNFDLRYNYTYYTVVVNILIMWLRPGSISCKPQDGASDLIVLIIVKTNKED